MALSDALGAIDPQGIVNDLMREHEPTLAQNGAIDPQSVLNRLIRKHQDARTQRKAADQPATNDFSAFGKTKDEVDAQPAEDFSQFGETPDEQKAEPASEPKKSDWGGYIPVAAKSLLRGATDVAGHTLRAAERGVAAIAPTIAATGGLEGSPLELPPQPRPDEKVTPIEERPLYRAGTKVKEWGEQTAPLTPTEEQSVTSQAARGVGGFAATVPAMAIGGVGGGGPGALMAGAAQMAGTGYESAFEEAITKGATEEQAAKAAGFNAIVSGGLGALPLGVVLAPVRRLGAGALGWSAMKLEQAARTGAVFATVGEAQKYLVETYGKEYDPKAHYEFDPKQFAAAFASGAVIGGVTPAHVGGGKEYRIDTEGDTTRPDTAAPDVAPPGLPPPSGGSAGAEPNAAKGNPKPPPDEPFESALKPKLRRTLEEKAAYYKEHEPDDIASWSDDKLKDYVNTKSGFGAFRDNDDHGGMYAAADDVLRRAGHGDDDIAGMSPKDRAAAVDEALREGVRAGTEPETPGTRAAPVEVKSADDVARAAAAAAQDYSHAQGEANNIQRGHLRWRGLDITIETAAGGTRRGTNPETGEPWETTHAVPNGYIKGTMGADGDHFDVLMGPEPEGDHPVYVLDEKDHESGDFRQHKAMIGFPSPRAAIDAYLGTSSKKPEHIGGLRAIDPDEFTSWVKDGTKDEPISDAMANKLPGGEFPRQEAGPEHHSAVEAALTEAGTDPRQVLPDDLTHAAEIHAREGIPPDEAFPVAVIRSLVADGHIKPEDVEEALGAEAKFLLHPRGDARNVASPETAGAAARGPAAEGARALDQGGAKEPAGAGGESAGSLGEAETAGDTAARAGAGGGAAGGKQPAGADAGRAQDEVTGIPDHSVTAADGTKIKVTPKVVEAADLITSSDQGYDSALQPRQRSRAASQAQIREIATRLDPERLGYSSEADRGAPIVGADRMVESGNGRVAALRAVYKHNSPAATRYRGWLKAQGVDVTKYKEPVLVRERITRLTPEERIAFTVAGNQAATLEMSAPERALADATHLTPETLDLITDGSNLGAAENRGFIRAFIGAIPASERGSLATADGALSSQGLTRAKNAVLAKAYGDADVISRITESTDDEVKSISNALVAAAPEWAKFRSEVEAGRVRRDLDVTPALMEAVKRTADLRNRGGKLDAYLAQHDALDNLPGPVEAWMRMFYDPRGRRAAGVKPIAEALRVYAQEAGKVTTSPGLGLDIPEVKADELQRLANDKARALSAGDATRSGEDRDEGRKQAARPEPGEGGEGAPAKGAPSKHTFTREAISSPRHAETDTGERSIVAAIDKLGERGNAWVDVPEGRIYLRAGQRPDIGRTLEIPNIEFDEGARGKGAFGKYLKLIEGEAGKRNFDAVYVEQLFNERLADYLRRRGYRAEPGGPFGRMSDQATLYKRVFDDSMFVANEPLELTNGSKPKTDTVEHLAAGVLDSAGNNHGKALREIAELLGLYQRHGGEEAKVAHWQKVAEQVRHWQRDKVSLVGERLTEAERDAREPRHAGLREGGDKFTERTLAGTQGFFPGTERVSSAELAKRRAAAPLKPKVAQKPMAGGLFGDESQQTDLVEQARKPDIPARVREAFNKLAGVPAQDSVRLSKLRAELSDIPRDKLDEALLAMRKAGDVNLMNLDNPRDIQAEGAAELRAGVNRFHVLWIDADKRGPHIKETKEPARGPEGDRVRQGAPQVSAGAPARRVPKAASRGGPDQLSLFGGPAGERPVSHAPGAEGPASGRSEASLPSEGGGVTKPPGGSQRGGLARHRNAGSRGRGLAQAQDKITERSRLNYRITDDDHLGAGGPKGKVRGNLDAIRTLKAIEDEGRLATPEEKAKLVKYVGWGAFAQDVFAQDVFAYHKPEWKAERTELHALLSEAEYEAAKGSTLNAHFTSPDVIKGIWNALDHLGFKGGLALEPAAGVGHFIGLVPDRLAPKTAWTAVELDPISGRIAHALYGGVEVNVKGFETLKRPSNYYDLAISNVPFGDYSISEKGVGTFPIHDFFFVKALDKVRPGGVVAFVTSRYTMDRLNPGTRRLLARNADLVGAIRLPGGKEGAFAKNAGTEVTTDVIFLRKNVPGQDFAAGAKWLDTREIATPEGPVKVNEYFADHPNMMLGDMRLLGTMYGKGEPVLVGESEGLGDRMAEAARATMPQGAFLDHGAPPPLAELHGSEIEGPVKDGAFFVQDGKLYQRRHGQGVEQRMAAEDQDRVSRLAGMRDTVNELLAEQLAAGPKSGQIRERLRKAYDAFVARHGPINQETTTVTSRMNKAGEPVVITRRPNLAPFLPDPDAYKVAAIENYNSETGKAKPADILLKDVIEPPKARQINSPADALSSSLDQAGGVDLDHVADALGLPSPEAAAHALGDLVYLNPDGRAWQTASDYLSGDVVKKLEEARAIAADDKGYARNVAALEKVQPEPLTRSDITAQFGAPWIPPHAYEAFLKEALGANKPTVKRVAVTGEWKVAIDTVSRDAHSKYATDRVPVAEIANAAINNRQVTVWDDAGDGKRAVNQAATEAARLKTEALKEAFAGDHESGLEGFVWGDDGRASELEAIYNRTYNNLVPQKFDGTHLTLPGLNPKFSDRQHRKDAVWRMIARGNTLLAHAVGSGKTVTMIAGGMEMKRLGLINKPAYVIPNHMLEQFSREFIEAYPNAKIIVAQKDEMTRERRLEFISKVAANDWDGVIITHDAFGRINMDVEWRKAYVRDQLAELGRIIKAEADEEGAKAPTVKALEKSKKKLQAKLDKLLNEERKDAGTSFEESGIDHLFVDEAHKFKNLSFVTRMQRVKGLAQGDAQRAEDLFLKIRYLEQKRPGRSAVFATGTPVSNTMAELWTMQRYLQLDKLKERELDVFDNWAQTFGRVATNMELSADGRTFKEVASFSKFVNVPELISLYSEISDTKTADMLKLPVPEVKTKSGAPGIEIVEAEPSAAEEDYINGLVKLAEELKGKRPKPGEPNMLSVVSRGRKVATDGRMVGTNEFNPRGKVAHAVDNIHSIWKEGKEPGLVQMVFLDLGTPQTRSAPKATMEPTERHDGKWDLKDTESGQWLGGAFQTREDAEAYIEEQRSGHRIDLYADIKRRLTEKGIPPAQIAAIHDAKDDAAKAKLFARVRAGDVRVFLGSSEKMGVGTNVQARLIAMHHLDAPWKPAEVEQRDGRIVRQGNQNKEVRILRYVTRRSFDAFMWQKLDTKSKFIAQVLSGAKGARHAEDIDNPLPEAAEMKAAASGDPRILEHAELDRSLRALAAQKRNFEQTQAKAQWQEKSARSALDLYEKDLPGARDDAAAAADLAGDKFKVTLGDQDYTDRKIAGETVLARMRTLNPSDLYTPRVIKVGEMSGFDMLMKVGGSWHRDGAFLTASFLLRRGENGRGYGGLSDLVLNEHTDPSGLMTRWKNVLDNIRREPERVERAIAGERDNLARIEKTLAETWPKERQYQEAQKKLAALTQDLRGLNATPAENDAVRALLTRKADPDEIQASALLQRAYKMIDAYPATNTQPGYGTPDYQAKREFNFGGERVTGYDAAIDRLTEEAKAFSKDGPVRNEKRAFIITGQAGAGKSSSAAEPLARSALAAIVDSDEAKPKMAEYRGGLGAGAVYGEADDITYGAPTRTGHPSVFDALLREGANVVIPRTGTKLETTRALRDRLAALGYEVNLVNAEVAPKEAFRRRIGRFLKTGRLISSDRNFTNATPDDDISTRNYYVLKREGTFDGTVNVDLNEATRITDGADTSLARELGDRGGAPGRGERQADAGDHRPGDRPQGGLTQVELPAGAPRALAGLGPHVPETALDAGVIVPMEEAPRYRLEEPVGPLWTGSAADFDKFDKRFIGTGEGGAMRGHGLYFSEGRRTPSRYRSMQASKGGDIADVAALQWLERAEGDTARALELFRAHADERGLSEPARERMEDAIANAPGVIYKIKAAEDKDNFLDWDAPVWTQPVIEARILPLVPKAVRERYQELKRQGRDGDADKLFEAIKQRLGNNERLTADTLLAAGVRGVKYLDDFTKDRPAAEQTRNFVLFDDARIRILEKNGKPVESAEEASAEGASPPPPEPGGQTAATETAENGPPSGAVSHSGAARSGRFNLDPETEETIRYYVSSSISGVVNHFAGTSIDLNAHTLVDNVLRNTAVALKLPLVRANEILRDKVARIVEEQARLARSIVNAFAGVAPGRVLVPYLNRATEILRRDGGEPVDAFERAVMAQDAETGVVTPADLRAAGFPEEAIDVSRQDAHEPGQGPAAEGAKPAEADADAGHGERARTPGARQGAADEVPQDEIPAHEGAEGNARGRIEDQGEFGRGGGAREPAEPGESGSAGRRLDVRGERGRGVAERGGLWAKEPTFTDLGPYRMRPDEPIGRQAQDYVVERGRATGVEHLVAVDAGGAVVGHSRGTQRAVDLSNTLIRASYDPSRAIVVHHNHPNDRSVSPPDMALLGRPGIAAVWAHGHDGTAERVALTPAARVALGRDVDAAVSRLYRIGVKIEKSLIGPLQNAHFAGDLTKREVEHLLPHLVARTLENAGLIEYRTNVDFGDAVERLGLDHFINSYAASVRGQVFRNRSNEAVSNDRRAEPLRHLGDVGASFERTRGAPEGHGVAERDDRQGEGLDRGEEEGSGQLRLPGLAEGGARFGPRPTPGAAAGGDGGARPPPGSPAAAAAPPSGPRPITGALTTTRTARAIKNFWTSTFQPELFSDRAFEADPLFARYKAASAQEKDALVRQSESEWGYWNKRGDPERVRFLDDMETAALGAVPPDPRQAGMARRYRAMLDANWELEKRYGSQAAFVEDYLPHIWEKPDEFRAFAETRSAQVGPTWFQKKRTIDYITDGLAAGLKLKYTNPVDIVTHRLMSGVDMRQRMDLLHKLKDMGLAWEGAQGGDMLVRRGWRAINAPDRKQWVLAPDVQLLWKNAVDAKGLWQAEHVGGSIFRGWMALKNAWVPLKLALSAFHPLHVLHIDQANALARGWNELTKGRDVVAAAKAFGEAAATFPTLGMIHYRQGAKARAGWGKRASQQSPAERATNALMTDGGFVPQLSEQLKIAAQRQLAEAWQKVRRGEAGASDWRKAVSAAMRRPIEKMQAPVFEKWIPALKAAAYLNETAALLKRRPELIDNDTERRVALRAIGKSIDNRYGEMFYGNLFWNRYLKDSAIGSFLSLGWNYGFLREFGGATFEAGSRPLGILPSFVPRAGRQLARDATNKIAFALAYMGTSALILGLMSAAMDDEHRLPHGLDFIFPRIGGVNPDGSPRRITNMSYIREVPMALKHVQERGGNVVSGLGEMLWNKLMFEPFHELLNNRDYYGYNIWDENAPIYKQFWQALKHTLGEQSNPMSLSGAKYAAELSGKPFRPGEPSTWLESAAAKGVGLSVLGFGPAPGYVEKSAMQNRIGHLYREHVAPSSNPEEKGENSRERMSVRNAILIAKRDKDLAGLRAAYERGKVLGMTQTSMTQIGVVPTDIYLFSRLPDADQKALLRTASPEEYQRYFPKAHSAVKTVIGKERAPAQ